MKAESFLILMTFNLIVFIFNVGDFFKNIETLPFILDGETLKTSNRSLEARLTFSTCRYRLFSL